MADYFKTTAVCRLLGRTYHEVIGLVRFDKIPAPSKDTSGDYVWTLADIDRARQALAGGRRRVARQEETAAVATA
jgi:hypothetical protein